jgi:signal transduction histidine kinase/DNA-binding response OmpR family regulator
MAASIDRGALATAPGAAWRSRWLGVVGLALLLALLAVAWVQGRQATLLNQTVRQSNDYVVLMVFQTETEYLRLREQWLRATDPREPLDAGALQLRYDIWVSRIALLHNPQTQQAVGDQADFRATMAQIDAFAAQADRLLGASPDKPLTREALEALVPELAALGAPLHGLTLRAAHNVGEQIAQRNDAVREHNQVGLALTAFLSALTLAFALIALRQVRQLEQRRATLEDLATNLRLARRDAEAASNAKSVFLANMSHEIRTPFHGLMGMLSLLRETGLTPRQIDYLRTATESADHLLAILNDILDMSQLESGRMTLTPAPVDLRVLLREVEALMRPQAIAKSLALHIDTDPSVPERVMADATRVKQVVFNLLSNAIKFSDQGAVVLDLRQREAEDGSATLEFVVTDTGIGMDEATVSTLFKRFTQGDGSRSRRHGGTGLGLEISRNLARLMGGDIAVRSRPGEGSVFTFRMPSQPVAALPSPNEPASAEAGTPSRPLQVLVAEDHPVNRQYMAALLESLGHHAHFTANGQEAVDAIRARFGGRHGGSFDLVLMDLHMPVLDGVGATRAIRALSDPAAATVPIVALTADAFPETRDRCLVAGMNDFLTKPVSPQKLAASLRRLFGAAGAHELPAAAPPPPPLAPAAGSPPLVDTAAIAMALQAMTPDRLAAMVHGFLDQGPQTVARLRAAVRDAEALELRVNAHAARGAALNLGLAALAATAEALHEGASHLPALEIARLVQRFEALLQLTRDAAVAAGLPRPAERHNGAPEPVVTR